MPLVKVEVRNEFGLGAAELYEHVDKDDDPKRVLDGVAVAGLVGVLRQIGDLAEFAAEIFQDLQEQVMSTSARSHKMMARLQHIEEALPPLENAVLSQKTHIHFAYTTGSNWHANIHTDRNHLTHSELPRFIMDNYDECRDPPRLHLLDKFDTGGPGACLKRYSDPSFFKRALVNSDPLGVKNVEPRKEARTRKEKWRGLKSRDVSHIKPASRHNGRMQGAARHQPNFEEETVYTWETKSKSEQGIETTSFDSRMRSDFIECTSDVSSSLSNVEHDDIVFQHGSDQERVMTSCSIKWDEKMEIVDRANQKSENIFEKQCEASHSMPGKSDPSMFECEDLGCETVDMEDIYCNVSNVLNSRSYGNQYNVVDGEQEDFVDALNTMVSESETDLETQITGGLEHEPATMSPGNKADVKHKPPNASHNFSKCMSTAFSAGASSENLFNAGPPRVTLVSSIGAATIDTDLCRNGNLLDLIKLESTNIQAPVGDNINRSVDQQLPSILSGGSSIKLWTNGSLLGLEPSKPPDSGMTNQDCMHGAVFNERCLKRDTIEAESHSDGHFRELDELAKSSKRVEVSPHPDEGRSGSCGAVLPEVYTDANQENVQCTSTLFVLGDRLHINELGKSVSPHHDRTSEPSKPECQTPLPSTKGHPNYLSATISTSPPLEHMKISFHPVGGFQTSKLKLKVQDGRFGLDGNTTDASFPSFQLLPDLTFISSDSDDDTFYKSSEYISDELMSNLSESNSEQWNSDETLESKDRDIYDALRRVSSTDSISSPFESNELPHTNIQSDLDNKKQFISNPRAIDSMLPYLSDISPPLPPLPPAQWRVIKPHSPLLQDNQVVTSKEVSNQNTLHCSKVTTEQPKWVPQEISHMKEPTESLPQNKNLNWEKEAKQAVDCRNFDQHDDLLNQIRSKSLSLRRTVPAKPILTPVTSSNFNVTAILEKANAIRQAFVGSDDEEGDEWSN